MDGKSLTPQELKLQQLKEILPEAFAEGKVDWEKLKATLGEDINFANERYVLNWAGKSESFKVLQAPTTKTLVPDKKESVNFDETENIFIEGENLEVLKVLQKSYFGKVKMIYIDPPYNTGNDSFIYPDKFSETKAEYEKRVGDKDEEGYLTKDGMFRKNSKENGQYHSNWLNMMYPRLFLAKNLLKQDGVIFISIDDNEVHNLRMMMNEVFGEENLLSVIAVNRTSEIASGNNVSKHEYVIAFAKNLLNVKVDGIEKYTVSRGTVGNAEQTMPIIEFPAGLPCYNLDDGTYPVTRKIEGSSENIENIEPIEVKDGKLAKAVKLKAKWRSSNDMRNFFDNNCQPTVAKINGIIEEIYFENNRFNPQIKKKTFEKISSLFLDNKRGSEDLKKLDLNLFDYPKSMVFIKNIIEKFNLKNEIILDFFAGSATLSHAIMEMNADKSSRKYICIQMQELTDKKSNMFKEGYQTISQFAIERIKRAGNFIKEKDKSNNSDLGFKVLKLSESNFKQWQQIKGKDAEALEEQMLNFVDPVTENATTENMVYELLLKSGKDLNSNLEHKNVPLSRAEGYYCVNDNELIFMLEKATQEIVDAIIEENPQKVVALDRLFKDNDQLKTNTSLQMRDAEIEFKTI